MDLMIEFVTENYVWIIVAGVVILMAVVGYIADKTDFGRNKIEKEPKEKKEKVKPEKVVKEKVKKEKNKKEKVVEELPIIEQNNLESVNNETFEQPLTTETQQDFLTENNTFANTDMTQDNQVDQSLFEPLPSIDEVFSEQPVEQNNVDVSTEPVNVNLTTEENQNSEVESDDDIWKF